MDVGRCSGAHIRWKRLELSRSTVPLAISLKLEMPAIREILSREEIT
jgi:hypothetical protein